MGYVLEKELLDRIPGCAFRVYNELGNGLLEKVYENALVHDLSKTGLRVEAQKKVEA